MIKFKTLMFGLAMLGIGYLLGTTGASTGQLVAQAPDAGIQDETADKIRVAHRALNDALESLRQEGRYETITDGVNAFLILAGGGNARQDLESGRGVDPETFAALYSGRAVPEVQELLDVDEQGRITYNNEVVRMYSKSRLQRIFAERTKINEVGF